MIAKVLTNVSGTIAPSILMLIFFAFLTRNLDSAELGIFMIFFTFLGFANFLDLGLSRAVIRLLNSEESLYLGDVIGTSLVFITCVASIVSFSIAIFSDQIVNVFNLNIDSDIDLTLAIHFLAAALLPLSAQIIILSIPEAKEDFLFYNIVKVSVFAFQLAICMFFFFNFEFVGLLYSFILARYLMASICAILVIWRYGFITLKFRMSVLLKMLNYGTWIALSNIISPLMGYVDRFILSAFIGPVAVAVYALPAELVQKLNIFPTVVSRTFFPRLNRLSKSSVDYNTVFYFQTKITFFLVIFLGAFLLLFNEYVLIVWLGEDFDKIQALIIKILSIGFIVNGLAQLPLSYLQTNGVSKPTAVLHMFEVLPYVALVVIMITHFGVIGAAIAWCVRVTVDAILILVLALRFSKQ